MKKNANLNDRQSWRTYLMVFLISMAMMLIFGACLRDEVVDNKTLAIYVSPDDDNSQYIMPDGTSGTGWESYHKAVEAWLANSKTKSFEIKIADSPLFEQGQQNVPLLATKWWKQITAQYEVKVDFHGNKLVGGCINHTGIVVNLMINKLHVKDPIVDLNIIMFTDAERDKLYLGLYNDGTFLHSFCKEICTSLPKNRDNHKVKDSIEHTIHDLVLATGVIAGIARAIAQAAAETVKQAFQEAAIAL